MIIDGAALRFPEDSARLRRAAKRLRPQDIESLEIIKGLAASERYLTDGRPVILIVTKRAK